MTRGRIAAALLIVLTLAIAAVHERVLRAAGGWLVRSDPLAAADALVVLAGSSGERELEAADLYRAGLVKQVLITSEREPEAHVALRQRGIGVVAPAEQRRQLLINLGIPDRAIVTLGGRPVLSTGDEASAVAAWIRANGGRRILVVTSGYHTARAGLLFERAVGGMGVAVSVRAAKHSEFDPATWWRDRISLKTGLYELEKLLLARVGID